MPQLNMTGYAKYRTSSLVPGNKCQTRFLVSEMYAEGTQFREKLHKEKMFLTGTIAKPVKGQERVV